ncbi:hypothetical protein [Neisseria elongata]
MQSWRPSETEQRVSDGLSFFRRPFLFQTASYPIAPAPDTPLYWHLSHMKRSTPCATKNPPATAYLKNGSDAACG